MRHESNNHTKARRPLRALALDIRLDNLIDDAPTKEEHIVGGGGNFDFDANDMAKALDTEGIILIACRWN
jgi:hypothetical protein